MRQVFERIKMHIFFIFITGMLAILFLYSASEGFTRLFELHLAQIPLVIQSILHAERKNIENFIDQQKFLVSFLASQKHLIEALSSGKLTSDPTSIEFILKDNLQICSNIPSNYGTVIEEIQVVSSDTQKILRVVKEESEDSYDNLLPSLLIHMKLNQIASSEVVISKVVMIGQTERTKRLIYLGTPITLNEETLGFLFIGVNLENKLTSLLGIGDAFSAKTALVSCDPSQYGIFLAHSNPDRVLDPQRGVLVFENDPFNFLSPEIPSAGKVLQGKASVAKFLSGPKSHLFFASVPIRGTTWVLLCVVDSRTMFAALERVQRMNINQTILYLILVLLIAALIVIMRDKRPPHRGSDNSSIGVSNSTAVNTFSTIGDK